MESREVLEEVTPCMGVWIETTKRALRDDLECVTPCMGVWIETPLNRAGEHSQRSHPVWVCGLKPAEKQVGLANVSHTLYGCVD